MSLSRPLKEAFDAYDDEFLNFARINDPASKRPDLHAFILLDRLVPGTQDIVSSSAHDEYFLQINPREFAAAATEEDVRDLVRCGVRYHDEYDCFAMFT
jgi:hypothetical protein